MHIDFLELRINNLDIKCTFEYDHGIIHFKLMQIYDEMYFQSVGTLWRVFKKHFAKFL